MFTPVVRFKWFGVAALLLAIVVVAVACGSDPTATQESTATPEPTATPVPTSTPIPPTAAPTEAPEAAIVSLEDLVLTPATTGKDLIDAVSEEEVACIKAAVGDAFFELLLVVPIMQASADPAAAAPLLGCLAVDSVLLFGIALFDAQSGGWAPETRTCMIGVAREHPDAILGALGMESSSAASVDHPYLVELYTCMTPEEQVAYILGFQDTVDSGTSAEGNIINVIPESEAGCIREGTTDEEYDMVLASTVHGAFGVSDSLAACIMPEGYVNIFVSITETTARGLSDESRSCLADFATNHTHYVCIDQS